MKTTTDLINALCKRHRCTIEVLADILGIPRASLYRLHRHEPALITRYRELLQAMKGK